jgi:hypothetical protein
MPHGDFIMVRPTTLSRERNAKKSHAELSEDAMAVCKADPFFGPLAQQYQPAYLLHDHRGFDLEKANTRDLLYRTKLTLTWFHIQHLYYENKGLESFAEEFAAHLSGDDPIMKEMFALAAKDRRIYELDEVMGCLLRWAENKRTPKGDQITRKTGFTESHD